MGAMPVAGLPEAGNHYLSGFYKLPLGGFFFPPRGSFLELPIGHTDLKGALKESMEKGQKVG